MNIKNNHHLKCTAEKVRGNTRLVLFPHEFTYRYGLIQITKSCNFNCIYCFQRSEGNANATNHISASQWAGIIRYLPNLGINRLFITGGEPLLNKDISKILETASKCFEVILLTNCSLITKELACLFKSLNIHVQIHLPSLDDTYYSQMKIYKEKEQIFNGISILLSEHLEDNIILTTTLHYYNYMTVDKIIQFAMKNKIRKVIFTFIYDKGKAKTNWNQLMIPISLRAKVANDIRQNALRLKEKMEIIICGEVFMLEEMYAMHIDPPLIPCSVITEEIQIDPNGEVTLCQFFSCIAKCLPFNNRSTIPFENFVTYREKRQPISLNIPPITNCKNCVGFTRCGVGCFEKLQENEF